MTVPMPVPEGGPLEELFVCPDCRGELSRGRDAWRCLACGREVSVVEGIPRFLRSALHDSFALQWNRFSDVQLDSRNGTTLSRDRLLDQSRLEPGDFVGRLVLEVGCGAGRFTEVLLGFGARVVALDYSAAIDACAAANRAAIEEGHLAVAQADVFRLPLRERAFDLVIGYGMLQHTGAPRRALRCLWPHVAPGGSLLVDRYQLDLRHVLPFKYALRPLLRRVPRGRLLRWVERVCRVLVPAERALLRRTQGGRFDRWPRYVLGRFPNSVFPINLEVQGRLAPDVAFRWSVLDTFDQYAPAYDLPCTAAAWRRQLRALSGGEVRYVGSHGQGNVGVVVRAS